MPSISPVVRRLPGAALMFAPLHFGPVAVEFPAVQAALSGYSDWPMRLIARRLGAPYTLCEVLLDQFVVNVTKGPKVRRFLHVTDDDHPCGAQLMGDEPELFALAAVKLAAAGFDVIDLNFACPVKKVLGRCRGGYLLSRPEMALEIVARVRDALPPQIPLTVKLRRGMDDTAESRDKFLRDFRRRFRPRRGGGDRPRPHRPPALRRDRLVGLSPRSEATCRRTDRAGQRRPVHAPRLPRHDGPDRRRRRQHRPRGDRQPWIFAQVRALAAGGPVLPPTLGRAADDHRRTLPAGRGTLRPEAHAQPDAEVRHQVLPACTRRPSGSATPSWPSPARPISTRCWRGGTRKTFRPSWQRHGVKRLTPRCQGARPQRKNRLLVDGCGCWGSDDNSSRGFPFAWPGCRMSPEGAAVNSQGREPWDRIKSVRMSPEGATVSPVSRLLSPLRGFR